MLKTFIEENGHIVGIRKEVIIFSRNLDWNDSTLKKILNLCGYSDSEIEEFDETKLTLETKLVNKIKVEPKNYD